MNPRETGWAIAHPRGIYTGWWLRRCDAIAEHTHQLGDTSKWVVGGKLDEAQKAAWHVLKRRGDRAVKVNISIIR